MLDINQKYGEWVLKYPAWIITISLFVIFVLSIGLTKLIFTNDYRIFFGPDNPQLIAFENLQDTYTKNENILLMLEPSNGDVFTLENLEAITELTETAWQIPYSVRVDSITNFQNSYSDASDSLVIENMVEIPTSNDAIDLINIRTNALNEPSLVNRLLSEDGSVTAINVTINMPDELSDRERRLPKAQRDEIDPLIAMPKIVSYVRNMIVEFENKYPEIKVYKTGVIIMNQSFLEGSIEDMSRLVPMALLAILFGVLVLIKSPIAMIGTFLVVVLSILGALGAAGWLGIKLSPPSSSAPTMILTLAVADCVHYFVTLCQKKRTGLDNKESILESLRINVSPIFLTSFTTIVGFLSLNFSDAPPFKDLGNITAIGISIAFILSITFLPAFTAFMPIRITGNRNSKISIVDKFAILIINKNREVFFIALALTIITISFVPRNEINDEFVEYFDENHSFRIETEYITEKMSGMYIIDYSLESNEEGGINKPSYLNQVETFSNYLRNQPHVQHVSSIVDTVKRLNRSLHDNNQTYYRLPNDREKTAQISMLYEMSLPFGLDLNNQVSFDKSASRVTVTTETMSTKELLEFQNNTLEWMKIHTPEIATLGSGTAAMFSHISMRNIMSMITGTSIAMVMITLMLMITLRSFKYGLIGLITNITPALIAFGVWGVMVGQVGLAVSVVLAMTLGIVVDDTIHFLSKYVRAKREDNMNSEQAIRYTFNTVGVALFITTVVLFCGFMVLAQSNFTVNSEMGLLTAVTIIIALLIDLLLLPAILIRCDKDKHDEGYVN